MKVRLTVAAAAATLLASIGLYPLYEAAGWFVSGLAAVVTAAVAGLLTRRLRVPVAAAPLVSLAVLLLCLMTVFADGRMALGVLPTPAALAQLGELAGDGWHAANSYAAPVPALPGIELLTAAGVGIVAIIVDLLAVRLRRAALAGLPLLALYSVPAAVRQSSVGWPAFMLGAAGFLALLVADARERLTAWGRPVFTRRWTAVAMRGERPDSSLLSISGRRIGLAAVVVAVIAPLAVPGVEPTGMFGLGGGGRGSGVASLNRPDPLDPLVSVRRQLVRESDLVVLRYRTTDSASPDYLRMYSLDRFDGEEWTAAPLRGGKDARVSGRALPAPPGLAGITTRQVTTKITVDRNVRDMDVLPAPYPPTRVDIKGDWRADPSSVMVFSPRDSAGGRTYTVTSIRPAPTSQQLRDAPAPPADVAGRYLSVPDALSGEVSALARKVTDAAATSYEKAVKLQQWFTRPGNFTYSLTTPPPRNVSALHDFLFGSRTGYCEQFAASMALLARTLGIPARVGMGYTAGVPQPDGTWVVRTRDAHAWPELYFGGVGWLRFEPTPGGAGGQGSASVPDYALPRLVPGAPDGSPSPGPSAGAPGTAPGGGALGPRQRRDDVLGGTSGGVAPARRKHSGAPAGLLPAMAVLALLLVLPAGLRRVIRVRRWLRARSDSAVAHAAWDDVRDSALDHGLPWRPGDSPRAAARRLAEVIGPQDPGLARIARAEERARYARTPDPAATLREDARAVRAAFAARATWPVRWRSRLLPRSATTGLARASGWVLDAVERLGSAPLRRRRT